MSRSLAGSFGRFPTKRWSYFIQKVYKTDLLICPKWALALPLRSPHRAAAFVSNDP